jgi:hypothetical protein
MRQKAVEQFGFDFAEVAKRSQLTFEGYEEGNISLDEYLDWVLFHEERSFSREDITAFMLTQSQPYPEMVELVRSLRAQRRERTPAATYRGGRSGTACRGRTGSAITTRARVRRGWAGQAGQVDVGWWVIWGLEGLGSATAVHRPRALLSSNHRT